MLHDTMAFTEDGVPSDLLDVQCWARKPQEAGSRLKIIPSSLPGLPYAILRQFFGSQKMWRLHFHTLCDKLFLFPSPFVRLSHGYSPVQPYDKELFWQILQHSSCHSPGHSRGLSPGVADVMANGISSDR